MPNDSLYDSSLSFSSSLYHQCLMFVDRHQNWAKCSVSIKKLPVHDLGSENKTLNWNVLSTNSTALDSVFTYYIKVQQFLI